MNEGNLFFLFIKHSIILLFYLKIQIFLSVQINCFYQ